jgi:hypothetical protein
MDTEQGAEKLSAKRSGFFRPRWMILIYPKVQLTLIVLNITTVVVSFILISWFLKLSMNQMISLGSDYGLPSHHVYFDYLRGQFDMLLGNIFYAFLIAAGAGALLTIWFTHKIVGPLVGLMQRLRTLKSFDKDELDKKIAVREGDFFNDLADVIREALSNKNK